MSKHTRPMLNLAYSPGQTHGLTLATLCAGLLLAAIPGALLQDSPGLTMRIEELRYLPNTVLDHLLDELQLEPNMWELRYGNEMPATHFQKVLIEAIRRGGPEWEKRLSRKVESAWPQLDGGMERLDAWHAENQNRFNEYHKRRSALLSLGDKYTLFLTALRRVQHKPDPLQVELAIVQDPEVWLKLWNSSSNKHVSPLEQWQENAASELRLENDILTQRKELSLPTTIGLRKKKLERELARHLEYLNTCYSYRDRLCNLELNKSKGKEEPIPDEIKGFTRALPLLVVSLKSADIERRPVWLPYLYGGNIVTSFNIEVRNANGELLPKRRNGNTGGKVSRELRDFGVAWKDLIDLSSYATISTPGVYAVTLLNSNFSEIGEIKEPAKLDEVICYRSKKFKLRIEKGPMVQIDLAPGSRQKARELINQLSEKLTIVVLGRPYAEDAYALIPPESPAGRLLLMKEQAGPELLDALKDPKTSRFQKGWALSLLKSVLDVPELDPQRYFQSLPPHHLTQGFRTTGEYDKAELDPRSQDRLINEWYQFKKEYIRIREAPN